MSGNPDSTFSETLEQKMEAAQESFHHAACALSQLVRESARLKTELEVLEQDIARKRIAASQFDTVIVMGEHIEFLEEENEELKEKLRILQLRLEVIEEERGAENVPTFQAHRPPLRRLDFSNAASEAPGT